MELRCGLITSHTWFHLSTTTHSNSDLIYRWGTWGAECWRGWPKLTQLWLADPWCELTRQPESGALSRPCYGPGELECQAEGKGLHAIVFSGQFIFGSTPAPCSAPCHASVSWNVPSSPYWPPRHAPAPHLDVEVVHSFRGGRRLTFKATALSIAVFILNQEEHTRTQHGG